MSSVLTHREVPMILKGPLDGVFGRIRDWSDFAFQKNIPLSENVISALPRRNMNDKFDCKNLVCLLMSQGMSPDGRVSQKMLVYDSRELERFYLSFNYCFNVKDSFGTFSQSRSLKNSKKLPVINFDSKGKSKLGLEILRSGWEVLRTPLCNSGYAFNANMYKPEILNLGGDTHVLRTYARVDKRRIGLVNLPIATDSLDYVENMSIFK